MLSCRLSAISIPLAAFHVCFFVASARAQTSEGSAIDREKLEFFEVNIRPVLVERCYECHSAAAEQVEGGLWLDSRQGVLRGGDSGPAVVPGNLAQSHLLKALTSKDNPMPPDGPLAAEQIDSFRRWIAEGALDPREVVEQPVRPEPDYSRAREYWAFQPVTMPPVPASKDTDWPLTPIDQFIAAKLDQVGLKPGSEATPQVLLRRLCFDLTGLPPTLELLDRFLQDPSDYAYRRIVDELLNSPQYGERQAQHWLDVVRFAETEGFEYDRLMPGLWRYRDYVIASFNADKPYDQFLVEQIAGDEISGDNRELRIAAGFHRLGAVRRNAGNQLVASSRNEVLTERTDIIGAAILGLTVGCARCHDHKFDPIPQRDYYRLQAYLAATEEDNISLRDPEDEARIVAVTRQLEKQLAELKDLLTDADEAEEVRIRAELEQLEAQMPPAGPMICSIRNDFENAPPVRLLTRGNPELEGPIVGMRPLGVLAPEDQAEVPHGVIDTPRLALARELVAPDHPLTARVIVNRIWQQHFGTGIVSTPNDFGKNGSPPSHPELLDYLAYQFVDGGWRLKELHRQIVTSRVYRQSSHRTETSRTVDPDNRWLAHFPRRRLHGEEIRDAMLCAAGRLNATVGGESVLLPVESALVEQLYKPTQWEVSQDPVQHYRRSIYLLAKRNLRLPFMEVFDQPDTQTSCAVRGESTHARQALELLNGSIANELAMAFADRLRGEAGRDSVRAIRLAFRLTTAREPSVEELAIAQRAIGEVGLPEFALAMFNLNSFLYVE